MHELSLYRVANQEMKDLKGLTYLIGCEATRFTKKGFCLITGLYCDKPYGLELEPSNVKLLIKYSPEKSHFVGKSSKGRKGKVKSKTAPEKVSKNIWVTYVELE